MSGLLLDSHVLLWSMGQTEKLSSRLREVIADPATRVVVSVASLWELAIKKSARRLELPDDFLEFVRRADFEILPIEAEHALTVADLPRHHNDPFDRMLIAQARLEGLILVTNDQQIAQYDVRVMMA